MAIAVGKRSVLLEARHAAVDAVSVDQLNKRFNFRLPLDFPHASRGKPLADWKMEIDDAPILRYLYRHFRPGRHLEFGTWQGWGALYCLEECDATVWTINLPFGEEKENGSWAYAHDDEQLADVRRWAAKLSIHPADGRKFFRTDQLGFVGRKYLERGYGKRVCQIYCDSREWDTGQYPPAFFDSVLIDGGHTPEVVINDTRKALHLLRPGGLVLWHDFCPEPQVRAQCSTPRDVVNAIYDNLDWVQSQTQDLFWIQPSWILAGIKS